MNSVAWVGPHDPKDQYDLQGLHNVDVSLFSLAVKSAWSLILHLRAGWDNLNAMRHDAEDLHDRLSTHSNLYFAWRDRYVPYHFHLYTRWDLVDLNDMLMFNREGICLITIFLDVCI